MTHYQLKVFALFSLMLSGTLCSLESHALKNEACGNNETCVTGKRPSTVIREQNDSPCYGCQPPPPPPHPLPSGDTGYRGTTTDVNVCKKIADLNKELERLTDRAATAEAELASLRVDIAGYDDLIRIQQRRVDSAQKAVNSSTVSTAGSAARCIVHANKPTPEGCADFDIRPYNQDKATLDREQTKLNSLNSAKKSKEDLLARNTQQIADAKKLQLKLRAQIRNLEDSGECKK